jgi:signal transduction histidine kinase
VDDVVREVVAILRSELDTHGIAVELQLDAHGLAVRADRGQLQHVMLDLAANALDAMAEVTGRPRVLGIAPGGDAAGSVVVSISDTGCGIDPAIAERIFDAFFTTRPQGTGMGLAICRSLISSHGGRLWLEQGRSPGATFRFTLPAERAQLPAQASVPASVA